MVPTPEAVLLSGTERKTLGQAHSEVTDEQWLQLGSWASRNWSDADTYAEEQEGSGFHWLPLKGALILGPSIQHSSLSALGNRCESPLERAQPRSPLSQGELMRRFHPQKSHPGKGEHRKPLSRAFYSWLSETASKSLKQTLVAIASPPPQP